MFFCLNLVTLLVSGLGSTSGIIDIYVACGSNISGSIAQNCSDTGRACPSLEDAATIIRQWSGTGAEFRILVNSTLEECKPSSMIEFSYASVDIIPADGSSFNVSCENATEGVFYVANSKFSSQAGFFHGCEAADGGGALFAVNSTIILSEWTITCGAGVNVPLVNSSMMAQTRKGALVARALQTIGGTFSSTPPLYQNMAVSGTAILIVDSTLTMESSSVSGCLAGGLGGAVAVVSSLANNTVDISDSTFVSNDLSLFAWLCPNGAVSDAVLDYTIFGGAHIGIVGLVSQISLQKNYFGNIGMYSECVIDINSITKSLALGSGVAIVLPVVDSVAVSVQLNIFQSLTLVGYELTSSAAVGGAFGFVFEMMTNSSVMITENIVTNAAIQVGLLLM